MSAILEELRSPNKSLELSFGLHKNVCLVYEFQWDSQPFIGGIPETNLLLSAAILFHGCQAEQSLRIFTTMGCATIKSAAFYIHQKRYLFPSIFKVWDLKQQSLFQQLSEDNTPLILGGDGRADSPGHSAKYGSYTMMDLDHKTILGIQLVQVRHKYTSLTCINMTL